MQWSLILSSWKNGKAVVSISYFSPFFESHNSSSKKPVVPPGSDLKEMAGSRPGALGAGLRSTAKGTREDHLTSQVWGMVKGRRPGS